MRLGVLGGTFDPPHIGHLIVAQDAAIALSLDRVLFIPAARPPHKLDRALTPAHIRLELLRAAVSGNPQFDVDPIEIEREGPSFTVDTLRALSRREKGATLVLLLGADQYAELDTWREPETIRALAEIAVMARAGALVDAATVTGVRRIDLSSTEIRQRTAEGKPIRYLVPEAVERLIRRHRLYGAAGPGPDAGGSTEDRPEPIQNAAKSW